MGDWHWQYLDDLEKKLEANPQLTEKYEIGNSNKKRLYLPDWEGIGRNEILSNPDMLLINRKNRTPEYIIEVEYGINYKKLVGIALLTDMAILKLKNRLKIETTPTLFLITKKKFQNSEFIELATRNYIKNINFRLFTTDTFNSLMVVQS